MTTLKGMEAQPALGKSKSKPEAEWGWDESREIKDEEFKTSAKLLLKQQIEEQPSALLVTPLLEVISLATSPCPRPKQETTVAPSATKIFLKHLHDPKYGYGNGNGHSKSSKGNRKSSS